jgi:hypothetical protein
MNLSILFEAVAHCYSLRRGHFVLAQAALRIAHSAFAFIHAMLSFGSRVSRDPMRNPGC